MRFDGRTALVTGSANGLGRAYAELLAAGGATVVLNDLASQAEQANAAVEAIKAAGGRAEAVFANVGVESEALALADRILDEHGHLDIFIHNAGSATGTLQEHLDVHVRSAIWILRQAWPKMVQQNYGRIVITTSGVGLFGAGARHTEGDTEATAFGEAWLYGVAKAGAVGLMRHLSIRGETANIVCNAISPVAYTEAMRRATDGLDETPRVKWIRESCPPEMVAPLVGYLAHESCSVTGEIYRAEGPQLSRIFIGETSGYANDELTIEDMSSHIAEICDDATYSVPGLAR
jgi:NAD(P)-dependent dehydrogenase (short-subunit alcohol dehydrogenase family)